MQVFNVRARFRKGSACTLHFSPPCKKREIGHLARVYFLARKLARVWFAVQVGLQGRRAAPAPRVLLMSCCEKAAGLRDTDLLELNPFPEMSQSQYCR